ncbi:hypothetical protein V8E53_010435 [Lactarius tabidus]
MNHLHSPRREALRSHQVIGRNHNCYGGPGRGARRFGVSDQLDAWLAIIYDMITKKHIHLPETSHLFLEIHQDLCACNYYFVDHVLCTVFWLLTLDILGIGCPRSSHVYLRHTLEKNYWIHVGLFPETASEYAVLRRP